MALGDVLAELFGSRRKDPVEEMKLQMLAQAGGPTATDASPDPGPMPTPDTAPVPVPRPDQPQPSEQPPPAPVPESVMTPPMPESYKTPGDLFQLYMEQMDRARQQQNTSDALTMIAAGLTGEQRTREALLDTIGGGRSGTTGTGSMFEQMNKMREAAQAAADQQKMRAMLPTLSKQYGVSMEALEGMLTGGTLEEFLKEASKPDNEIRQLNDGSSVLIDKKSGAIKAQIDGPKKPEVEMMAAPDGKGGMVAVDKRPDGLFIHGTDTPYTNVQRPPNKVTMQPDPSGSGGQVAVEERPEGLFIQGTETPYNIVKPVPKQIRVEKTANGQFQRIGEDGNPIGEPFGAPANVTTDDITEWMRDTENGEQAGVSLKQWILDTKKAGATKIDLGGAGKLEETLGTKAGERWDKDYESALGAADAVQSIKTAREQLEKGIVAGSALSPVELEGRKVWADVFGLPDAAIANTETFQAVLKEVVLDKIKALGSGSGISNSDREYVNAAVAGNISMNEESMKRILDIHERVQTNKVNKYNAAVDEFMADMDDDEKKKFKHLLRKVKLPEKRKVVINGVTIEEQ